MLRDFTQNGSDLLVNRIKGEQRVVSLRCKQELDKMQQDEGETEQESFQWVERMFRWIEKDKEQDRTAVLMRFTGQRQDQFRALGDQNKKWEVLSGNKNMALFLITTATGLV